MPAAPTLSESRLEGRLLQPLFHEAMRNVELMIQNGMIHGDLSAYNILYWQGKITLIDFPQVVDPYNNPDAFAIFRRDVERICQYFDRLGVGSQPGRIARDLWHKHIRPAA